MNKMYDYKSGEEIREATETELAASKEAAEKDGGSGVIVVDGKSVYVL
jgi:hypothetical protein